MSQTVPHRRLGDMNSRQRTVYEAVPKQDWWTTSQVVAELTRMNKNWSMPHCTRVLLELTKMNLVTAKGATANHTFQRTPIREQTVSLVNKDEEPRSFEGLICAVEDARNSMSQARDQMNIAVRRLEAVSVYVDDLAKETTSDNEKEDLKEQLQALLTRVNSL